MKSIVEEASSIAKAVEKGWVRAGKPQEFSVKIFEEPEKNFFGLTTKPAKIAIVFAQAPSHAKTTHESRERTDRRPSRDTERRPSAQHEARGQERRERHHDRQDDRQEQRQDRRHDRQDRQERQPRQDRDRRPARDQQAQPPREHRDRERTEQRSHDREQGSQQAPRQHHADSTKTWEQPAVSFAQTWITECLTHLGLPNVTAQLTSSANVLNIQLGSPIADNGRNERFFLSSLSHLLSEALRTQLKLDMRGLRIIISSN